MSFFNLSSDLFSIIVKKVNQIKNNVVWFEAHLVFVFCGALTTGRCNAFQHIFLNQKKLEFYGSYLWTMLFLVTMLKQNEGNFSCNYDGVWVVRNQAFLGEGGGSILYWLREIISRATYMIRTIEHQLVSQDNEILELIYLTQCQVRQEASFHNTVPFLSSGLFFSSFYIGTWALILIVRLLVITNSYKSQQSNTCSKLIILEFMNMFKVNNKDTRTTWVCHISHLFQVCLLLTLNK